MSQPALSLEVLRAEHGDCLLLHHGDDIILIDGGPSGVYKPTLKPRLQELMAERPRPLFQQMVMVSHIDDDHIVGLTEMFGEAVERREKRLGPPGWTIRSRKPPTSTARSSTWRAPSCSPGPGTGRCCSPATHARTRSWPGWRARGCSRTPSR